MRRAVDGRLRVVFLETTLPPLKEVTVTLATGVFLTALVAFVAVCEVLRVLLLRGVVAFAGVGAVVDLTGIRNEFRVFTFLLLPQKNPFGGFGGQFVNCLRNR